MDDAPIMGQPTRRRGWRVALLLLAAFFAGSAAMAMALRHYGDWLVPRTGSPVALPVVPGGKVTPVLIVPEASATPAAIDLNALSAREKALASSVAALEARADAIDGEARAASAYATRAEGLMVAVAARRALDRGLALGYVERQLDLRFGGTQPGAVATIVQASRDPVTIEDLRVGLDAIAAELATGAASGGWLASLERELRNLIVIHKVGTPSPLPVDRLARARRMLEAGQVEAALAEVARMPGAAQARRWTDAARRYIGARQALDTIEATAIGDAPAAAPDVPGRGPMPPNP